MNFSELLKDKNVAIIGNAESVLSRKKEIDNKHDVIVRMNRGFPKGKEEYIGSRTDILATSLPLSEQDIKENYNPKFIVWCTPKKELMTTYLRMNSIYYPIVNWNVLYSTLCARPSTGCMIFDFIYNYRNFKSLHLYGFDFWATNNWYTNRIHLAQHDPNQEKKYILSTLNTLEEGHYHDYE